MNITQMIRYQLELIFLLQDTILFVEIYQCKKFALQGSSLGSYDTYGKSNPLNSYVAIEDLE